MSTDVYFSDRGEAARALAEKLGDLDLKNPVVLGIPRGAVFMAKMIAQRLRGEFDVVLVRKLPHPEQREFAVGSITESGRVLLGSGGRRLGLEVEDLEAEAHWQLDEIRRRRRIYTPHRGPIDLHGRTVVIVDDGIATGSTMEAAIVSARALGALRVIAAAPVASDSAVELLTSIGAEIVVVAVPAFFFSVSQFYERFDQLTDEDVIEALRESEEKEGVFTHS
ncbi:MAG TPA: phosphoribosyltransferase family protein [Bdellovibrionales bacterium]|nr:phosphoribosyltransferase family protein [Bdellovibrionales bacterium]